MEFSDNEAFVPHAGTGIVAVSCPGGTGAGVDMFPLLECLYVMLRLCFPSSKIGWLTLANTDVYWQTRTFFCIVFKYDCGS